ncbi:hypothetical protein CMT89_13820 [Elizabethkingia anophelis]|uniref:Uncharacterized protein n=1 Tax=Elizabethkingia anophelis R26 TaxID=1246994 RepID=A0ABM6MT47_9FLAO|nr:hypothetical protein [Elizabethkingia anophelis]ATC36249.1 hypothetical protein BAZ09_008495 [Elizabethkingia anophelis R26]ATC39926.1 hypothetical protein EAAG1_008710 [Elizabethkingia anophelis Ag1]ATC43604.1 hypothetical protein CMV41_08710 [Elizabethkingia anophelis]ATC47280.1 hypothetical protein CMV40_08710 [Elizabethkingia anophelis]AVF47927.1 hypothetical protein AL491_07455 [Elizabethkingia anophelis]
MDQNYHKDLSHIRHMMERSTRFLSLSGMSGIVTGVIALLGAAYAYNYLGTSGFDYEGRSLHTVEDKVTHLIIVALIVLVSAIFFGGLFTWRNIKKSGQPFWTMATKKLLFNFCIPLALGGLFCIGLIIHQYYILLAPMMLFVYGAALFSAEKYTLKLVRFFGISEMLLGLVALFFPGHGLLFWALGFGVLHIVYGILMYKK